MQRERVHSAAHLVVHRIATGPHAGRKALTLRTVGSTPPPDHPRIAQLSGFSLHAGLLFLVLLRGIPTAIPRSVP